MTNKEKFRDEIENFVFSGKGSFGVRSNGNMQPCYSDICIDCIFDDKKELCSAMRYKWLTSEYKEPEKKKIDLPDDIAVDTPILVKDSIQEGWIKRYFSHIDNGFVYAFNDGRTSWSSDGSKTKWKYAKLPYEK